MALPPSLDFEAYVKNRQTAIAETALLAPGHEYAYISDRQTREAFERMKPVELAVASSVRTYKAVLRNQLLGNSVRISERQFPRIYALVKQCADTLQIATPQVYLVNNPVFNAATLGTNDDSIVLVHSALIDHYTDAELLMVLGHECGHIHNSHVSYLTALYYLTQAAGAVGSHAIGPLMRWFLEPALIALRAWSRRAEITCDRAGMLCAADADTSARAMTKLVLGSKKLYDDFNLDAFLDQYREGNEGIGKYMEAFATHPWLPKRVLAMRVFAQSALYRKAKGLGLEGLAMPDVDEKVRTLLKGD